MFSFLFDFFQKNAIDCYAPIPLSACTVTRRYLLERHGIGDSGTAVMIALPYYTHACDDPARNLSAYATSRDYHGFFRDFFERLIPALEAKFPAYRFAGFADHSPIDERDAAVRAGLGVIGKNGLLLTERYSSYVFLGELITDAPLACEAHPIRTCEDCGACQRACPIDTCGGCLSALTQKKGELTETEAQNVLKYRSVWGCDICQEVCPHTRRAKNAGTIYSPIPYFHEQTIPTLTSEILDRMSDEEFSSRAFSWRGRETIRRNLLLFEAAKKGAQEC